MRKKKILFLGGAYSQLPAIQYAKSKGLYVITADYLPENPGHRISDEYHNISTIDKDKILELALRLNINAISAYASDPAALIAAFVSDKMGLVGGSYNAVSVLSEKTLFRKFLHDNNLLCPWFLAGTTLEELLPDYNGTRAVLKPIDSSGSKGVAFIENRDELIHKFNFSKSFSPSGKVILEQFIERKGPQIHGEGFVINGQLVFLLLGDQIFSTENNLAPYSTTLPSYFHQDIMSEVDSLVEKIIQKVGFKSGGINVEVIRDPNDNIYVLEIGARNGGNFMPQLEYHATGFDLVKANVDILLREPVAINYHIPVEKYFTQVILHAKKAGHYEEINIPQEFLPLVCEKNILLEKGQLVDIYKNSGDVIGVLIIESPSKKTYQSLQQYLTLNDWVNVSK